MKQRDWRSLVAFAAAGLIVGACSRSSPLSPEPATGPPSLSKKSSPPTEVTPLVGGSFTITTRDGTLTGTYVGEGRGPSGAFTLALTGGTGAFVGASGLLSGSGHGGFTGEGKFSYVMEGQLSTAAGSRKIRIGLKGTSTLSCVNGLVFLTATGSGAASGFGPITAVATHQIGNAGCDAD